MPETPKLLDIRIYGDSILRLKAVEITEIDDALKEFAEDLVNTMYHRDGVGLAAPQVGVSKRMIAIDPFWGSNINKRDPLIMINPAIEKSDGETDTEEGCISVPDIYAKVTRPSEVKVSFTTLDGEKRLVKYSGFPAVVVQHEIDHLNGVLFTDHLGTLAKLQVLRKLKALEKMAVDGVNIRGED